MTYIPRTIPFFVFEGKELPAKLNQFLEFVPYTALGALIIPGALSAIPDKPMISITGLVFAGVFSYFKKGLMIPIVGSMGIIYLLLLVL